MRYICIFPLTLSAMAYGLDVGLGVGVTTDMDARTISVPIRFESMILEPYGEYQKITQDESYADYDTQTYTLGCGAFYRKSIRESLDLLVGGRIALVRSVGNVDYRDESMTDVENTTAGYIIQPACGLDWSVNEFVSVGIEAGIKYYKHTFEQNYDGAAEDDENDYKRIDTVTKLWLRMYL